MTSGSSQDRPAFRIRPARRGDAEALRYLVAELGHGDLADAQTVSWLVSHPEIELMVAVDPLDRCIGVISLSHRPQLRLGGRIATFDEIIVTESWRRRGVGKALLNNAVTRAKTLGVRRIEIYPHAVHYPSAHAFCAAAGFHKVPGGIMRMEFPAPARR
ncbi:MAG: GNAT family N-acetyltransferase [Deltaproteobacteria bacterium]|nr:GNAT family N-acetyltransferase [Deltaproteobacteria bacterium]